MQLFFFLVGEHFYKTVHIGYECQLDFFRIETFQIGHVSPVTLEPDIIDPELLFFRFLKDGHIHRILDPGHHDPDMAELVSLLPDTAI